MIITIDTNEPLNDFDRQVLRMVAGVPVPDEEAPAEAEAKPAKKTAAKKTAKKSAAKLAAVPEPDESDDNDALRNKAVEAARDLLESGEREKVMAVLSELEVGRVSDLPDESLQAFIDALNA